jgi:hypothetical protein
MRTWSLSGAFLLASLVLAGGPVHARDASDYSTQDLVQALMQRLGKTLRAGPSRDAPGNDAAIVVLEGKALTLQPRLHSVPGMRVLTQEQLVQEQRAVFLIISQLGMQGPDILIDFETPSNASFGTLRVQDQAGKLVFKFEDSYRSSSGARATYARLYGGLLCQDGSEMAYRFDYRSGPAGKCPVQHFPRSDSALDW